jgi:hypothetical protein
MSISDSTLEGGARKMSLNSQNNPAVDSLEALEDVIISKVVAVNESAPQEGGRFQNYSTFVTLAGGIRAVAQGRKSDIPKVGRVAAFKVAQSSTGKMAKILGWGWPYFTGSGSLNKGEVKVAINLVKEFSRNGTVDDGSGVDE